MEFFDCNCRFGFETVPMTSYSKTAEELVREMDFNGISRALAVHSESFYDRPTPKSFRTDRLCPVLNFLPYHNVEELEAGQFRQTILAGKFSAMRFQPQKGRYGLSGRLFYPQFSAADRMRLPLLLDLNQPGQDYLLDFETVDRFLSLFPDLPVILTNTAYRIDTTLYPLMDRHENFYVETSGYQGFRNIEQLVKTFGAKRVLFGTRYPFFYPAAARCRVETADLTAEEKERIAHKNLEELLEGIDYED